jgi:hypothetical protein
MIHVCIIAIVVIAFIQLYYNLDVYSESFERYATYSRKLSKGWLFGRKLDNSDGQFRPFRDNMPLLSFVFIAYTISTRLLKKLRVMDRLLSSVLLNFAYVFGLHGISFIVKIMPIVLLNYYATKYFKESKANLIFTWIFGIGLLFWLDFDSRKRFEFYNLPYFDTLFAGFLSRWQIFFKFTVIRMISFNLDYRAKFTFDFKTYFEVVTYSCLTYT